MTKLREAIAEELLAGSSRGIGKRQSHAKGKKKGLKNDMRQALHKDLELRFSGQATYHNTDTRQLMYNVKSHEARSTKNKRKIEYIKPSQFELPFKARGLQWQGHPSITTRQLQQVC